MSASACLTFDPRQVLFASIMEILGNEALGKIMNIVDEAKLLVGLESGRGGKRPQTSVLNILNKARVGTYTGSSPANQTHLPGMLPHDDVILTRRVICPSQRSNTRTESDLRALTHTNPLR